MPGENRIELFTRFCRYSGPRDERRGGDDADDTGDEANRPVHEGSRSAA